MRLTRILPVAFLAGAAAVAASPLLAPAADHGDSPQVRFDARVDVNDVYLFESPQTAGNVVMIATVCPLAGAIGPATFADKVPYTFRMDLDGDAIEDQTFTVTFTKPDAAGAQKVTVKAKGPLKFSAKGVTGAEFALPSGGKCEAKIFDDPFFFDLIAFKNGLAFNSNGGTNFFRGLNTLAIVIEFPSALLDDSTFGIWVTTNKGKKQIDRMGRPAINTVLVPGAKKDIFNSAQPRNDAANHRADAVAIITSLGNAGGAVALSELLFPDILTIDLGSPSAFPNGRALQDDVIDIELGLLSNNGVTSDFVPSDTTFLTVFPYLRDKNP